MPWFKTEAQKEAQKKEEAERAEYQRRMAELDLKQIEKARIRKERLARGEIPRNIPVYAAASRELHGEAGYAGAFEEEWHTAEEWAEINRATKESDAKRWREEEEKYAPIRRAREKEKKNAEITKCRQVIAEANAVTGGNRTKKYRKNKNKNTKKYRKNKNKNTRRKH